MSSETVRLLEQGKQSPRLATARAIAHGVSEPLAAVFPEFSDVPDQEPAAWAKVAVTTLRLALRDIDREPVEPGARALLRSEVVALIAVVEERGWPL